MRLLIHELERSVRYQSGTEGKIGETGHAFAHIGGCGVGRIRILPGLGPVSSGEAAGQAPVTVLSRPRKSGLN